jgi:L-threonylcarbamoyladenylate synthase
VGIPTETVYGLAADALNGEAVENIFKAKGRPMDNPLIVHINDIADIERFALSDSFSEKAQALADAFWPGPLTIIVPKGNSIPQQVSAGLDTVAIRLPEHPVARAIIKSADTPLAAPSANISGSPSPTTAEHVMNDMNGKIDAVLDGGHCSVGLESTVITVATEVPRLLRPGGITPEQLESVIGEIEIDDAVLNQLKDKEKAASPGMKYKHYAPKAKVIMVRGKDFVSFVNNHADNSTMALCYDEDIEKLTVKRYSLGGKESYHVQAQRLFDALRGIDENPEIKLVYARCPEPTGVGMAVYNRLIRAAGFEVLDLEKL